MAKADLKSAFRLCPVNPLDWPLLGFRWRKQFFVDKCLPFGLSSPYLFNLLADALQWCLLHHFDIHTSFHYLDDFFFAGLADTEVCTRAITAFQHLCHNLGVPLKPKKLVLPCTNMTFLGIQLNSSTQVASLPPDKLTACPPYSPRSSSPTLPGGHHGHQTIPPFINRQTLICHQGDSRGPDLPQTPPGPCTLRLPPGNSTPSIHGQCTRYQLVVHFRVVMERQGFLYRPAMVSVTGHGFIHGRLLRSRVRGLLEWPLVTRALAPRTTTPLHPMERIVRNRHGV